MSCGAEHFVNQLKLHGCLYHKCHKCKSEVCLHWPYCPKCTKDRLDKATETLFFCKGALSCCITVAEKVALARIEEFIWESR